MAKSMDSSSVTLLREQVPKSYPSKDFGNLIPVTVTFDTLVLSKTGPLVSEWKEITTVNLG